MLGSYARLSYRASRGKRNRVSNSVTPGEVLQNLGSSGTEGAVPRGVFRKWRSRKRAHLVWNPVPSVHGDCAFARTAPSTDLLPMEQVGDRRHRTHRIKHPLGVPTSYASVENGVGQREEHLRVLIDSVMISGRDELSEQ